MLRISPLLAAAAVLLAAAPTASSQQIASSTPSHGPSLYVRTADVAAATSPHGHSTPPINLAAHTEPPDDARRLGRLTPPNPSEKDGGPSADDSPLPLAIPRGSITTMLAALSLVSGLLLLAMWSLKRSVPKSSQILPAEAGEVLGRMPLGPKQFAHLIKLGDKLVLVFIAPTAAHALTEVTDPKQVARLVALCSHRDQQGAKASFEDILKELSSESERGGYARA